jgi:phospholipid/cholesterol/gamma-HCH transport system substrate-binding protein
MPQPPGARKLSPHFVRVAILGAVGLLLLAYAVYRVGGVFDIFARRYEVVTLVPSAQGLRTGAPVTLAGQHVGQVSAIEFIPPAQKVGANNLRLRLAISERVRDQIRADSRAFLRTQGLLGDKFVDIAPGSPGMPILVEGDTVPAGEIASIDQIMEHAGSAIDTAMFVISGLRAITEGVARGEGTIGRLLTEEQLYNELVATTASLRRTIQELNRADGTFGRLLHDPALYESVTGAVARLDSVGALALHSDGTVGQLLRSDTLHRSLLSTVARADTAVAHLSQFLGEMTEGDGTIQRLFTDPALYDEVLRAIVDVQNLINAIRVDPERYRPDVRVRVF